MVDESVRVLMVASGAVTDPMLESAIVDAGFSVRTVGTAAEVRAANPYDVIVLDTDLPDLDGRELCRRLREADPAMPIVLVSESGGEFDRVLGFELGADEYVVRPFSIREFVARLGALTRRAGLTARSAPSPEVVGGVTIDRRSRRVCVGGSEVHFTVKEFDVLAFLCEDPGAVRTRSEILQAVWGTEWFGPTKTLDAHVAAIRRKLDGVLTISALRGVGFRVDPTA